jgi:hypothetical protein
VITPADLDTERSVLVNVATPSLDMPQAFSLQPGWRTSLMGIVGGRIEHSPYGWDENIKYLVFVPWSNVLSLKQDVTKKQSEEKPA